MKGDVPAALPLNYVPNEVASRPSLIRRPFDAMKEAPFTGEYQFPGIEKGTRTVKARDGSTVEIEVPLFKIKGEDGKTYEGEALVTWMDTSFRYNRPK